MKAILEALGSAVLEAPALVALGSICAAIYLLWSIGARRA
jgi:hypothetical protein